MQIQVFSPNVCAGIQAMHRDATPALYHHAQRTLQKVNLDHEGHSNVVYILRCARKVKEL